MESEFFGYKKGAFTGAEADRDGFFQAANGGTLFLDEVADLPLPMQVKLLRAIQEKKVRKVGATQEEPVDVRIISATHKKLARAGRRRRVPPGPLLPAARDRAAMPTLREMREDIPLIANAILAKLVARRPAQPRARGRRRRSSAIRSPATCASSRTSSSAACRSPRIRSTSPPTTCT